MSVAGVFKHRLHWDAQVASWTDGPHQSFLILPFSLRNFGPEKVAGQFLITPCADALVKSLFLQAEV